MREQIFKTNLKKQQRAHELHSLVINRIYHEDNLLVQRTANFLTASGLLAAVLALTWKAGEQSTVLSYVIIGSGLLLSLFQMSLGYVTNCSILYWRAYLRQIESLIRLSFDSSLYDFYKHGSAATLGAEIRVKKHKKRRQVIECIINMIPSMNTVVALLLPLFVTGFWMLLFVCLLCPEHKKVMWLINGSVPIVLVLFFWLMPRPPKLKQ